MTKKLIVTRRVSFEHQNFLQTDFGLVIFEPSQTSLEFPVEQYDSFSRYLDVFKLEVVEVEESEAQVVEEKEEDKAPVVDTEVVEEPVETPAEESVVEAVEAPVETTVEAPVVEEAAPVEEVAATEETPLPEDEEEVVEDVVADDGTHSKKTTRTKRRK